MTLSVVVETNMKREVTKPATLQAASSSGQSPRAKVKAATGMTSVAASRSDVHRLTTKKLDRLWRSWEDRMITTMLHTLPPTAVNITVAMATRAV